VEILVHLVWGTKTVRKMRGRRADYCLLCRRFQAFRVVELADVAHINHIPLGRRIRQGYEVICESCSLLHTRLGPHAEPVVSNDRHANVDTLLADTNPDAPQTWAEHLEIEDRIRTNQLDHDKRLTALDQAFLLANTLLENRMMTPRIDLLVGLGIIGLLAAVLFAAVVMDSPILPEDARGIAALAVTASALLFLFVVFATMGRRDASRVVLTILVRAITPLRPTAHEIDVSLERLRDRKGKLGTYLKTNRVFDAVALSYD
jgi:hypothetical protein